MGVILPSERKTAAIPVCSDSLNFVIGGIECKRTFNVFIFES